MYGNVTFLALQRLAVQAWEEGDQQRLMFLSEALDRCMLELIREEEADCQAV